MFEARGKQWIPGLTENYLKIGIESPPGTPLQPGASVQCRVTDRFADETRGGISADPETSVDVYGECTDPLSRVV